MSSFQIKSKSYLTELVRLASNSPKTFGCEKIVVDGTVKRLTIPIDARYAMMVLESIRYRNSSKISLETNQNSNKFYWNADIMVLLMIY